LLSVAKSVFLNALAFAVVMMGVAVLAPMIVLAEMFVLTVPVRPQLSRVATR
jgi:hypothetical protein